MFSRVVGKPLHAEVEYSSDPDRVDHVLLTFTINHNAEMIAALNTISRRNRDAGFDSRVRVGTVVSSWEQLPEPGIFECGHFDYAEIERHANVFFEHHDQPGTESLLRGKIARAICVEAWGDIYAHRRTGIHQIHSRRGSCAVPEDIVGRDGPLKLYYAAENVCELLLFKFCGQP